MPLKVTFSCRCSSLLKVQLLDPDVFPPLRVQLLEEIFSLLKAQFLKVDFFASKVKLLETDFFPL